MRNLDDVKNDLPAERRARVEARAMTIVRAEGLRQLRKALKKTQHELAGATGMSQHNVSRLEQRNDMLLSTLNGYVEGLGGRLRIIAEMPGQEAIELDLSGRVPARQARRRRAGKAI